MATSYENVPVFRSGHRQDDPNAVIGKAQVEIDEESKKSTITIETVGIDITEFLKIGTLRSFELSVAISDVDNEKAKEYWSRRP